jgi:CheY-like chemotaxis protein
MLGENLTPSEQSGSDVSRTTVNSAAGPLLLIVEDDPDTREMYAEWFHYSGFRVVATSSADEAVQHASQLRPALIMTDIDLTGNRDGYALCSALKADPRTRDIPIVVVTGWASGDDLRQARHAGCDVVVTKPCLPDALLSTVEGLLAARRSLRPLAPAHL